MSLDSALPLIPAGPAHVVQFYEAEPFLASVVTDFVRAGLARGDACLLIATSAHRRAFKTALRAAGCDPVELARLGRLTFLDAEAVLNKVMLDNRPDPLKFDEVVGGVVRDALNRDGSSTVTAYGEMVDLLWQSGRRQAAIELEELWNGLAEKHPFTLLCTYSMDGFLKSVDDEGLTAICHRHGHVRVAESVALAASESDRQMTILRLQQRAAALEAEVAHRKSLEQALRDALREQRRAEGVAAERQQELTDFFENAAEGLHWVGPDGRILWANPAELELVDRTADEYLGHHISEFHADLPSLATLLERLARNETVQNFPAQLRRKDGSIREVIITSNVFWRDGAFVHTRCFTRDITDLKHAREQLEVAVRARDDFISIASHELRNPVHVLQLQAAGLLEETRRRESISRDWVVDRVGRVARQVSRLGRLLDNLLDVSRLTAGRLPVEREELDASVVVADVVQRYRDQPDAPEIIATFEPCPGQWDRLRLDQVASNLVSNAIKFGGGRPIDVRMTCSETSVVLAVTDRGVGIGDEDQAHLFSRFQRAVQDRQYGGFGLGLWITREIVTAMDGTIEVRSQLGEGSVFTVTLPR